MHDKLREANAIIDNLKTINAELLEALADAKFRLFGAGPSTDPLYGRMRDALAKAQETDNA
ncbi:hypothetical protein LCGC14_0653790 [marine sediment metagenome]|uniref:Uncharacterized protein n=1 Tax=marine sediment metagenome TaxID=412755 RepID=A0A0F9R0T6_9ZZZZ